MPPIGGKVAWLIGLRGQYKQIHEVLNGFLLRADLSLLCQLPTRAGNLLSVLISNIRFMCLDKIAPTKPIGQGIDALGFLCRHL